MHAGDLNEDEYKTHINLRNFLKNIFPSVYSYRAYIPFLENEWGFTIASRNKKFNPGTQDEKIIKKKSRNTVSKTNSDYLNPETLKASFVFSPRLEKSSKSIDINSRYDIFKIEKIFFCFLIFNFLGESKN